MVSEIQYLWYFLKIFLLGYIVFVVILYLVQDFLIFFPRRMTDEQWREVGERLDGEAMEVAVSNDVTLRGWFLPARGERSHSTLLFFGGNAMRLSEAAFGLDRLRGGGIHLVLVDYRGYGASNGKPSAEALMRDSLSIYDAIAARSDVDPTRITAWGWSLGTGVATHLASKRDIARLILFAPFVSTVDLARKAAPFVPVQLLLRHKIDNLSLAPGLQMPVLIVHGESDATYPVAHAERLARAWGGESKLTVVAQRGHDDLLEEEAVWQNVEEFLGTGTAR